MDKKTGNRKYFNAFLETLGDFLDKYEEANPEYLAISFCQLLYDFVYNLQRYIENPEAKGITWDNPFVELQYFLPAADLDKLEAKNYTISEEELKDPDKAADRIYAAFQVTKETAFLKAYTKNLALLKEGDKLYMLSPEDKEKLQELEKKPPIKLPFTVTAPDKKGKEREVNVTLSFKIDPLTFDRGLEKAYFPIFLGLEFKGYHPTRWTEESRAEFWEVLRGAIKGITPEEKLDFKLALPEPEGKPISEETALVKCGLHVELQKLGRKKRGQQMSLDDLDTESREAVSQHKVTATGVDLTEAENKALFAIQNLLTETDYLGNVEGRELDGQGPFSYKSYLPSLKFSPAEYLEAYGVTKYQSERGYMEFSNAERKIALRALATLSIKPFLIWYERKYWEEEKGKKVERIQAIRTVRPLLIITEGYDKLTRKEAETLRAGGQTEETAAKLDVIGIEPSPILVDQINSYFVLKPANIYEEIAILTPYAKKHKYIYRFIDYLLAQAELKRRSNTGWTIKINYKELAEKLRMDPWLDSRNWKQIRGSLNECYKIAQRLGYLEKYKTKQGVTKEVEELTLNPDKIIRSEKAKEKREEIDAQGGQIENNITSAY